MMDRTTRPLVIVAAFAGSLAGRAGADAVGAWAACAASRRRPRSAGPFQLTDQSGPGRHREEPEGQADADLLRLHPLPGRLPDLAVRDFGSAEGDGQGRRSRQRLFRLGRSRARHGRRDEGLSVELRSASEGADRRSRGGGQVLSAYRVYAKKVPLKDGDYTMDHTALIYLMDRDGHFVSPFNLNRKPEEAAGRSEAVSLSRLAALLTPKTALASSARMVYKALKIPRNFRSCERCPRPCSPIAPNLAAAPSCAWSWPGDGARACGCLARLRLWPSASRPARRHRRRQRPRRRSRPPRRRCPASGTRGGGRTGRTCRASP